MGISEFIGVAGTRNWAVNTRSSKAWSRIHRSQELLSDHERLHWSDQCYDPRWWGVGGCIVPGSDWGGGGAWFGRWWWVILNHNKLGFWGKTTIGIFEIMVVLILVHVLYLIWPKSNMIRLLLGIGWKVIWLNLALLKRRKYVLFKLV